MFHERMSLQSLLVLLVALVGCTSLVVHGQSVAIRSGSDEESGIADESDAGAGGQSRTIYSHKHLSPHRMMHFGKRLLVQQAPGIYTTTNQVLDLYRRQPAAASAGAADQQGQEQQPSFPYTLYFPMPRDRMLESGQLQDSAGTARGRQMMNAVQDLLSRQQQQQLAGCETNTIGQQQQQAQFRRQTAGFGQPKLLRLVKADAYESSNESSSSGNADNQESVQPMFAAKKQSPSSSGEPSQQAEGGGAGQPEQRDASGTSNGRSEGDEIDRSSRSVGLGRAPLPGLTRAQFSMLFGSPPPSSGSQASSLLNFIKKAEPQRMTFMHFGRRR